MWYYLVIYALMVLIELITIRATCAILQLRSNKAYAATLLIAIVVVRVLRDFTSIPLPNLAIAIFFTFLFPIICSVGPLPTRITRSALLSLTGLVSELVGSVIGAVLSHGAMHPEEIAAQSTFLVVLTYAFIIPIDFLAREALINFFGNEQAREESDLSLPAFFLVGASLALVTMVYGRVFATNTISGPLSASMLGFYLLDLVVSFAMLYVARRDAIVRRTIAERTATQRQIKHLRSQVASLTATARSVSFLRHDLANQIEVVRRLAADGKVTDADRYLLTLQHEAAGLTERTHHQESSSL